jgi:hypothetical protein
MPTFTGEFKHVGVVGQVDASVEYEIFASFEVGIEGPHPTLSTHNAATIWFRMRRRSHAGIERVLTPLNKEDPCHYNGLARS